MPKRRTGSIRGKRSCRHHNRKGDYQVRKGWTRDQVARMESRIMDKPPGSWCLEKITRPVQESDQKCDHNRGQWVVKWGDKFYIFDPATQLQKDIWLSNAGIKVMDAMKLLRWFCWECGNIQMP